MRTKIRRLPNMQKAKRQKAKPASTITKVRKHHSNVDKSLVVNDYIDGKMTVTQIAKKHSTTTNNIELIVKRHWRALTNMRESRALLGGTKLVNSKVPDGNAIALKELRNTKTINEQFIAKLSKDDGSSLLTEEEAQYAWILVHTGDVIEAITQTGLDIGLAKDEGRETRNSWDRAVILRSYYLNAKPNIKAYIAKLREEKFLEEDVGKVRVQKEILEQLTQLKAIGDPRSRKDILRCIELLGKSTGSFVERIEISEVNPEDALDKLIEMAEEATVRELTTTTAILEG